MIQGVAVKQWRERKEDADVPPCGGCGTTATSYRLQCSKCGKTEACPRCMRLDTITSKNICPSCDTDRHRYKVEITGLDAEDGRLTIRWKFVDRPGNGWGELSLFLRDEVWHIDTESMNNDVVESAFLALPKFLKRAG